MLHDSTVGELLPTRMRSSNSMHARSHPMRASVQHANLRIVDRHHLGIRGGHGWHPSLEGIRTRILIALSLQQFVSCLCQPLHCLGGAGCCVLIRMHTKRQLQPCLFDLSRCRRSAEAQNTVIIIRVSLQYALNRGHVFLRVTSRRVLLLLIRRRCSGRTVRSGFSITA